MKTNAPSSTKPSSCRQTEPAAASRDHRDPAVQLQWHSLLLPRNLSYFCTASDAVGRRRSRILLATDNNRRVFEFSTMYPDDLSGIQSCSAVIRDHSYVSMLLT